VNLASVDLNLLLVFDALMIERSVTKAGNRVCLSQPAVSAALNRLRHLTNDELFVRRTDGMHPTQRALELEDPIRKALLQINDALEPQAFSPSESTRSFCIALNDLGAAMIMPHLASSLSHIAPQINITVEHADGEQAIRLIESGKVDMAVGLFDKPGDTVEFEKLYDIPFSCAMRFNHPLIGKDIDIDHFAATSQLAITHDGGISRMIDKLLVHHAKRRRIAFTVPHFLAGAFVLTNTDLIATLPNKLIRRFGSAAGIRAVEMPFAQMQIECGMAWNKETSKSHAHIWMRSLLRDICNAYHQWE
jgi:DNA-binding transcriptional LysR family regulator